MLLTVTVDSCPDDHSSGDSKQVGTGSSVVVVEVDSLP